MTEFWETVRELERFWAWIVAAASLPFLASLIEITPPWPPAITVLTSIIAIVAVVLAYHFARTMKNRSVSVIVVITIVVLFIFSATYLGMLSQFSAKISDGSRVVTGFVCTPYAQQIYPDRCPWLTESELKLAEWTPSLLWTSLSITASRMALVIFWLGSFLLLSFFLGLFIVVQRRRRPASTR
ncbi:MAG: hypothetical protein KDK07_03960 [Bauldia sp.]|nr:hypothetical protein [Bauldia sp.]